MKKYILLTISLMASTMTNAQKAAERQFSYMPEGTKFVCTNGTNRYTRALYGSHTPYRLETSDRPLFAVYKKKGNKNITFSLRCNGQTLRLDSATWCRASYEPYRRDYTLRDARWGNGELQMSVVSQINREGAVWRVIAKGFNTPVSIEGTICETSTDKMTRNGDIGSFRNPTAFDSPPHPLMAQSQTACMKGDSEAFFILNDTTLSVEPAGKDAARLFAQSQQEATQMAGTVSFTTPDPFINPIGGAMVAAADGAWDGTVWNHGAVGWRTPLNGWRAAYMGDWLGMPDRQAVHFEAYARSQVTDVPPVIPHPTPDSAQNLARGRYEWGSPMYSNGYICSKPNNSHQFNHYDMNLVFIDELLWHFAFDADTTLMRRMWPVIKSHLEWEKRNWDPDDDALYDAYCCIWASDALQYNSGAGTHSSAYNYRGNLLAARMAELLGEDPAPYRNEARRILEAMNSRLWMPEEGCWAEFQDFMGLKRLHRSAALWSIYTPIDCGACSPEQAFRATQYIDRHIPHIPFTLGGETYKTVSTTDWHPYDWSINNVAMGEVMHTVLAYYEAGRTEEAYELLKGCILDFMYAGSSPANFGQISYLDHALGESYRDFSDVTGITSRALIQGLYGITPDAMEGRCIIRPGFPADWDSASIHTPYLDYTFRRSGGKETYTVSQRFAKPLKIVIRQNLGNGRFTDTELTADSTQTVTLPSRTKAADMVAPLQVESTARGTALNDVRTASCQPVNIDKTFNSAVSDIFKNEYLSPRSPYTTLSLPKQGIGDWCSTKRTAVIDDSALRALATGDRFTAAGIPFRTPQQGRNIAYTSLWDNYPDSITFRLKGSASHVYLLMAGSTNPMQSRIDNGILRVEYQDGSTDELPLRNPDNWCPIEQDYADNGLAFTLPHPRPYRVGLATGRVSRTLFNDLQLEQDRKLGDEPSSKRQMLFIPGGAAQIIDFATNPKKRLRSITMRTLSNDVVMGVMAITIQK